MYYRGMSVNQRAVLLAAIIAFVVFLLLRSQPRHTVAERCQRILVERAGARVGNPPPRPSDEAWYAEKCWDGRAR